MPYNGGMSDWDHWLAPLAGNWNLEHIGRMGPDGEAYVTRGTLTGRWIGERWWVGESNWSGEEGGTHTSIMTLGYNPEADRFVATFIGSMMSHLWVYDGHVDPSTGRLVMVVDGPSFAGEGTSTYEDSVEIVNPDHWILRSRVKLPSGEWFEFMEGHHRRA